MCAFYFFLRGNVGPLGVEPSYGNTTSSAPWPSRFGSAGELTYLHFTDLGAEPLTRKDLPFCQEVIAIPKPPAYGPTKLVQGVFSRWSLPILNYTSEEMSAAVDRLTHLILTI